MKFESAVEPEAESDLGSAIDWYERQRPGLGAAFELSVDATIQRIRRMPELAAQIFRDIRRRSVSKFPFGVFCRLESGLIRVVAIMHVSRDPNTWQSRA
jgi:plasmid stabilization system protein ParE